MREIQFEGKNVERKGNRKGEKKDAEDRGVKENSDAIQIRKLLTVEIESN